MGRMKEEFMRLQETPVMDPCTECHGAGTVLEDAPMAHNFNRDVGYMDTKTVTCGTCNGAEEMERLCTQCEGWVTLIVGEDATICEDCTNEPH